MAAPLYPSSSRSQTITEPLPQVLRLPLQLTSVQNVQALLAEIREAAKALPHDCQGKVFDAIDKWEQMFFFKYQMDSRLDNMRLAAAHAILFFRRITIKPIILCAVNDLEKLKWLRAYNQLRDITASILPPSALAPHETIDAFIECHEQKLQAIIMNQKAQKMRPEIAQMLKTMNAMFAELERDLYANVNRVTRELQTEFEALKKQLQALNAEQKEAADELFAEIDKLTQTVGNIYQDLKLQLKEAQDIDKKIELQENVLMSTLDGCLSAVDKV